MDGLLDVTLSQTR